MLLTHRQIESRVRCQLLVIHGQNGKGVGGGGCSKLPRRGDTLVKAVCHHEIGEKHLTTNFSRCRHLAETFSPAAATQNPTENKTPTAHKSKTRQKEEYIE